MVKKLNGKWKMCVDFSDLNNACLKDLYPLPTIDMLVDNASGCGLLNFLNAYLGYNRISMHPDDEEKTTFMGRQPPTVTMLCPSDLKNVSASYQRLMDRILKTLSGHKIHAYVEDMVVTSNRAKEHFVDSPSSFLLWTPTDSNSIQINVCLESKQANSWDSCLQKEELKRIPTSVRQ